LRPIRFQFGEPGFRRRQPAILLDRDGVINERIWGGYVTRWEEFRLIEGIVPVLRALSRLRAPMIVVSNQSGVNKGLVARASLRGITARFVEALARERVRITAAYYCPHTDDQACGCRKPKPGMLLEAARDYRIDLSRSVMVGDSSCDVEAAAAAGCRGILLDSASEELPRERLWAAGSGAPTWVTLKQVADLTDGVRTMLGAT
jgi:D-glycero-D-manno-heptose 1,7-bisphosphate phosphatase